LPRTTILRYALLNTAATWLVRSSTFDRAAIAVSLVVNLCARRHSDRSYCRNRIVPAINHEKNVVVLEELGMLRTHSFTVRGHYVRSC
jgi:hypothetical protein